MSTGFSTLDASKAFKPKTKFGGVAQQPARTWKRAAEETRRSHDAIERTPTPDCPGGPKEPCQTSATHGAVSDYAQYRQRYVDEKAAVVEMPTEEEAVLKPKYLFSEPTFVIHLCWDCRVASRKMQVLELEGGNQGLVINLCTVCRAWINYQRNQKFFKHELPCHKRKQFNA